MRKTSRGYPLKRFQLGKRTRFFKTKPQVSDKEFVSSFLRVSPLARVCPDVDSAHKISKIKYKEIYTKIVSPIPFDIFFLSGEMHTAPRCPTRLFPDLFWPFQQNMDFFGKKCAKSPRRTKKVHVLLKRRVGG